MASQWQPIFGSGLDQIAAQRYNWAGMDVANRSANIARKNQAQSYWDEGAAQNAEVARRENAQRIATELALRNREDTLRMAEQDRQRRAYEFGKTMDFSYEQLDAGREAEAARADDIFADREERRAEEVSKIQTFGKNLAANFMGAKKQAETAQADYEDVEAQINAIQEQIDAAVASDSKAIIPAAWRNKQKELVSRLDKDIRPRLRKSESALERLYLNAQNSGFEIDEENGIVVHAPTGFKLSFRANMKQAQSPGQFNPVMGDARRADEEGMRNYFAANPTASTQAQPAPAVAGPDSFSPFPGMRTNSYFGQDTQTATAPTAPVKRMFAKNPRTGQRIYSDDGGNTWNAVTQ